MHKNYAFKAYSLWKVNQNLHFFFVKCCSKKHFFVYIFVTQGFLPQFE